MHVKGELFQGSGEQPVDSSCPALPACRPEDTVHGGRGIEFTVTDLLPSGLTATSRLGDSGTFC